MRRRCWSKPLGAVLLALFSLTGAGCGYRVAGTASRLPTDLAVIAVPAFESSSTWMRLEHRLSAAVMQEFIHRTRYQVVGSEEGADAVLNGRVLQVYSYPVIFDPDTGRASAVLVTVVLSVELRDLRSKKVLYSNPNLVAREQYEITGDLDTYFEERGPMLDRLARDVAATVVSAVLENF